MIRRAAIARGVPYTTTLSAASAAADAIIALRSRELSVRSLQERSDTTAADDDQPRRSVKAVTP